MIPRELKRRAEARARSLGLSFGELVRTALEASLRVKSTGAARDPLFASDEIADGAAPRDVSADPDRYLYGES